MHQIPLLGNQGGLGDTRRSFFYNIQKIKCCCATCSEVLDLGVAGGGGSRCYGEVKKVIM